ncbi:aminotransferase class V-fold PLP-dependent enzyme [Salmonirosea aquatica]|uniref:phosphoserine transaminase n=1 Tax=Salmonirosea aquatica TaxID=2654236 RepID=A0A7C9FNN3_9BACT|nr:aminotransferase class V-fold PLP-dependent enzyme [Cytophagaceae bacterium SJW1-29]
MNLTFYPGPSQLYPQVEGYLQDAYSSGILSMNHRSTAFMDMMAQTIAGLHEKLNIPLDYEVYFTSSATECWEIISQSLVEKSSLHAFNGAFGAKWFEYAQRLHPAFGHEFEFNTLLDVEASEHFAKSELLCLTHNETSNGTALSYQSLKHTRKNFAGLIAVDATSSMAGVVLPWEMGDVWFASVQKCFGLPPGLGVLIVSPRAIEKAKAIGERNHYNSLLFVRDNFQKNQTPYTPNTLAIYLLGRVMQQVPPIELVDDEIVKRAEDLYAFFHDEGFEVLVDKPSVRSHTVMALRGAEGWINALREKALENGVLLGKGYGTWKNTSLRIANFPALTDSDLSRLKKIMESQNPA